MMPDREKVISTFEKIINVCKEDGCDFVDLTFEDAEQILALLKEQEAVEPKQIVRIQRTTEHSDRSVEYYADWFCPHCNSLLKRGFDAKWIAYCFRCGKPITWEGK